MTFSQFYSKLFCFLFLFEIIFCFKAVIYKLKILNFWLLLVIMLIISLKLNLKMGIKNLVSKEHYILFKLQIFGGFFLLWLMNANIIYNKNIIIYVNKINFSLFSFFISLFLCKNNWSIINMYRINLIFN